jgi:hypothetical protein
MISILSQRVLIGAAVLTVNVFVSASVFAQKDEAVPLNAKVWNSIG